MKLNRNILIYCLPILYCGCLFLFLVKSDTAVAQTTEIKKAKPAKPKDTGQDAIVKIDGSAVYEVANFDSPVIEYMDQGKKIKISKKIYPGIGGLGAFYKVKIKTGVYGYITDTDVEITSSKSEAIRSEKKKNEIDGSEDPSQVQEGLFKEGEEDEKDGSIYLSKFIGLNYSRIQYAEELRNKTEQSQISIFGVRRTGPTSMLGGMPIDMSLMLTTSAPDFYDEIASSTSGMMLLSDFYVLMPFYESPKILVHYGLGLLLRYSKWDVKLRSQPNSPELPSEELALGAALQAGLGYRINNKFLIRSDAKYVYENESYLGVGFSFQVQYE